MIARLKTLLYPALFVTLLTGAACASFSAFKAPTPIDVTQETLTVTTGLQALSSQVALLEAAKVVPTSVATWWMLRMVDAGPIIAQFDKAVQVWSRVKTITPELVAAAQRFRDFMKSVATSLHGPLKDAIQSSLDLVLASLGRLASLIPQGTSTSLAVTQ